MFAFSILDTRRDCLLSSIVIHPCISSIGRKSYTKNAVYETLFGAKISSIRNKIGDAGVIVMARVFSSSSICGRLSLASALPDLSISAVALVA